MTSENFEKPLKVLVFCDYYFPGFRGGGPITTIRNMVLALSKTVEFKIVTRAHDLGEAANYSDVLINEWQIRDGAHVLYTSGRDVVTRRIRSMVLHEQPDVIYLNSALSRRFSLVPLLAAKWASKSLSPHPRIILAPRGEFSRGALSLNPVRKKVYLGLLQRLGIWRNVIWQASTPHEAEDIRRVAGNLAHICIAADLPSQNIASDQKKPKIAGKAIIAFVGRVSPMKNLDAALRILGQLHGDIEFVIVGPVEDEKYWRKCWAEINSLPPHVRVTVKGPLPPNGVRTVLGQSDLFFLPSLGENFAHVVLEALGAGCPVVLSDRTPWRDLRAAGIGADIALEDETGIVEALQDLVDCDELSFREKSDAAKRYARRVMSDDNLGEQYVSMFGGRGLS